MKDEKGITIVSLIITLIVVAIIAGVAIYNGTESIEGSNKVAFVSEMEIIQAKVNSIYEERKNNNAKIEYYNLIGKDLSDIDENLLRTVLGENTRDGFKYFSYEELAKLGLDNIVREVLINYDTREVISLTGIEIKGITYYKLKDIPDYKGLNIEYVDKNTSGPAFELEQTKMSSNEWKLVLKNIVYSGNIKKRNSKL